MVNTPTLLQFLYVIFSITILINSYLLFQIQPIISKYILPWFGGTSFVWITSLLFFQLLLLAGYLYSFILSRLSLRIQFIAHSLLVFCCIIIVALLFSQWSTPITPGVESKIPDIYSPVIQVLALLGISVGLPYFLLSTTSTLLQHWFSKLPHNKSPYPLYALSNVGSLLAICAYPFFIEPFFTIQYQGNIWSGFFVLLCVLLIICILLTGVLLTATFRNKSKSTSRSSLQKQKKIPEINVQYHWKHIVLWIYYPAVSSILLTAVTHQLTQGIAPIPFIWLIPLGLYLLSFILCFSEKNYYHRNFFAYIFLLSGITTIFILLSAFMIGIIPELILYTIMLLSAFMICHGELFHSRPHASQLNIYYLIISAGSVIGSIIVAIIAPLFFVGLYWEFLLGLYLTTIIAVLIITVDTTSVLSKKLQSVFSSDTEKKYIFVTLVSIIFLFFSWYTFTTQYTNSIGVWRNFYGILRVLENDKKQLRCLTNGKINHGCQPTQQSERMKPTMYFGENSVGLVFKSIRTHTSTPLKIGGIGLGVGTIASYGQKDDTLIFYELNPLDVSIAKQYFTYLSDTKASVQIRIGDGRSLLEKELKENNNQQFDIFIMDAFNDDAIPVHLLTKEAFALYKEHVKKDGIIAVHISNSYLDLRPVITKSAEYHALHVQFIDSPPTNPTESRSRWALLAQNKQLLHTAEIKKVQWEKSNKDIAIWTDDFSNLFQIITIR